MFNFFKKRKYDYTHWDIHALARVLAPEDWQIADLETGSVIKTTNEYLNFPNLTASVRQAAAILARGDIFPAHRNLTSSLDVKKFQLELDIKRAEHKLTWSIANNEKR